MNSCGVNRSLRLEDDVEDILVSCVCVYQRPVCVYEGVIGMCFMMIDLLCDGDMYVKCWCDIDIMSPLIHIYYISITYIPYDNQSSYSQ